MLLPVLISPRSPLHGFLGSTTERHAVGRNMTSVRPAAMAVTLVIFSTGVAICLLLLLAYDRPFAAGGVTLTPTAFREINFD
jgi:hypothetical protein